MKDIQNLNSTAYLYTLFTIFQAIIRLFFYLFAAKILGPLEYSYWPLIQAIMTYSVLIGFGIMPAFGRELPILRGANKIEDFHLVKYNTLRYLVYYWGIILFCTFFIIFFYYDIRFYAYGVILAVLQSCIQFYIKIHRSYFNFNRLSISILISNLWILASFFIILKFPTYDFLFLLFAISLFIYLILLIDYNDIRYLLFESKKPLSKVIIKKLHNIGFPLLCAGFFISFLYSIDRWFVNYFFSKEILGQYSVAVFFIMGIRLLIDSLGQIYLPTIAFGYGKHKSLKNETKHLFSFIIITLFLMIFLIIFTWFIAPKLFLIYLPEYIAGLAAAKWLVLGSIAMPFATLCSIILQVKKMVWYLFWGQLVGLILSSIIIYIGIQYDSIIILGKFISISYILFTLCLLFVTFLSNQKTKKI